MPICVRSLPFSLGEEGGSNRLVSPETGEEFSPRIKIAHRGHVRSSADRYLASGATMSRHLLPQGEKEQEKVTRVCLHRPTYRLCHPDRDQRGAGVLPAGAHHARRSAGCGAAGGCVAGTRGATAHRLRLRPAAAGAVRPLAVAGAPRRSRQFHRHRPPGAVGSVARGQQHRDACDCGSPDRLHARAAVRPDRRLLPRHLGRQGRDLDCDRRRLGAALLARHGAGHHLLGAAQLAARGRRRSRRLRRLGLGLGALEISASCRRSRPR